MPFYLTRFSYTPETWAKLVKNPEDRRAAAQQYIESVGGKLHGFWVARRFFGGDYVGSCRASQSWQSFEWGVAAVRRTRRRLRPLRTSARGQRCAHDASRDR